MKQSINRPNKTSKPRATKNPIIDAAKPVFIYTNALAATDSELKVDNILFNFNKLIKKFESKAALNGVSASLTTLAKYCLCTFVDESVASYQWSDNTWSQKSLLVTEFNEAWGGERFFEILVNAELNVNKNVNLIELIHLCLQLGYQGKYRLIDNGDLILADIKEEVLSVLESKRVPTINRLFADAGQNPNKDYSITRFKLPVWLVGVICGLFIVLLYIVFRWSLGTMVDATNNNFGQLVDSFNPNRTLTRPAPDTALVDEKLKTGLKSYIDANLLTVEDYTDRSVITIIGNDVFKSADYHINDKYLPALADVGSLLKDMDGRIVVTGYTDDIPIKSLKYQSNWQLSQARAGSVARELARFIPDKNRLHAEGAGSNDPIVPNDSEENRAKNRRVEIVIYEANNSNNYIGH